MPNTFNDGAAAEIITRSAGVRVQVVGEGIVRSEEVTHGILTASDEARRLSQGLAAELDQLVEIEVLGAGSGSWARESHPL